MTTTRAVRFRCEIQSQLELDEGGNPSIARVLELSEAGAFIEEVPGLADVQPGDGAVIGIPLPGGEPWVTHVRFTRHGYGRIDVKTRAAEHVSVSVRGFGASFDELSGEDVERLRGFLELLETR